MVYNSTRQYFPGDGCGATEWDSYSDILICFVIYLFSLCVSCWYFLPTNLRHELWSRRECKALNVMLVLFALYVLLSFLQCYSDFQWRDERCRLTKTSHFPRLWGCHIRDAVDVLAACATWQSPSSWGNHSVRSCIGTDSISCISFALLLACLEEVLKGVSSGNINDFEDSFRLFIDLYRIFSYVVMLWCSCMDLHQWVSSVIIL